MWTWLESLFSRAHQERTLDRELRFHIEEQIRDNVRAGMRPEEARRQALIDFGGVEQVKEECRDVTGWRALERILRDIRVGARALRKSPGFTVVALLTFALCIGANTATFSVIYALILRPLPFPTPSRIVEIYNVFPKGGLPKEPCSVIQYLECKGQTSLYDAVGLWGSSVVTLGEPSTLDRLPAAHCTAEMFDVLGLRPILGQFFTLANNRPGEDREVILTQSFWESHYAEDPGVLGKMLRIDGEAYRIIGVAPRALEAFDPRSKLIKPMAWDAQAVSAFARFHLNTPLFARLKEGQGIDAARAAADALEQHYYDIAPVNMKAFLDNSGHRVAVVPLQFERTRPVAQSLWLLQGAAGFVLLIGCVNMANLLMARTSSRQHEIAVRAALGATRGTILAQFLIEYLLLNLAGIVLGIGLAQVCLPFANHFIARALPTALPVRFDAGAMALATGAFVLLGLTVGAVPVLHVLRHRASGGLQRTSREGSAGRGTRRLSGVLITGQIATALVLLSGAGLLVRSFAKAISVDPGFEPSHVVEATVAVPETYRSDAHWGPLVDLVIQSLREIPGIESAALATSVPFMGTDNSNPFTIRNDARPAGSPQAVGQFIGVSPGYFDTLHIPLLAGRIFDSSDLTAGRSAYVVDERFAQKFFPGRSAVGGRFAYDRPPGAPPEKDSEIPVIVGVVRWVPNNGIEDRSDNPFVYYPIKTKPKDGLCLFVRSARSAGDLMVDVREKIGAIDPSIAVLDVTTLQAAVSRSYENREAIMSVLGAFAALALFLSGIGIYGVLAYDVSLRTRELGIRGAIGASRLQITGLIMRQTLWKIVLGSAIGLVAAALLSRFTVSLLYQVSPTDPIAYAAVLLLLVAVALLGSYLPAHRAAHIDPLVALRNE